ncbi:MAG TPA: hypothetical protein DCR24_13705 [Bacillus bacterium]|nr:hypothetical protein [Bacillus sp. (in: firmicutes)]
MLRKRLKIILLATIITGLIAFFFLTIPAVFAGASIYSIIMDTVPKSGKTPLLADYIKNCLLYILTGVIGWEIYTLSFYHDLNFASLYMPAFFSFLYYNILILISQYKD